MKTHLRFIYILCFTLITSFAEAQSIDTILKTYSSQYEQEKVHIHFDKDIYLPGETIWAKAYVLLGSKPSDLSKNIYFDWTDANGNLLLHGTAPLVSGTAAASFVIPADFEYGAVHVKAYTQWMLNFDNAFLYNKDIPVLTPWKGNDQHAEKQLVQIRFFPEGGDLVTGLRSSLAFEATDQHGMPLNVKGIVKNSNNEIVDSFASVHNGMGLLRIRPAANEKYTAFWKDESGELHSTSLPETKSTGALMRMVVSNNGIHYQVERTADCPDNFKSLTLMATCHQQLVWKSSVSLGANALAEGTIPTGGLSTGIMQLTLLDANMTPFAERVVFVNNHQYELIPQVRNEQVNLGKRGRNEISIEIPDSLETNLSISVTDGGLGYDSSNHIITDFLLSGDLKGNIINPSYYLSGNADSIRFHLDLLMLTHGWRRFKWEEALAGKLPVLKYQPETDYLNLKGQIVSAGAPFENGDSIALLLMSRDGKKYVVSLPVNGDGSFLQKGMFFYDSVQIVYRLNHSNKLNAGSTVNFQTSLLPADSLVAAVNPGFGWIRVPDVILEKELNGALTEFRDYSRLTPGLNYVFSPKKTDSAKGIIETAAHYLEFNFPGYKFPYSSAPKNAEHLYASFSANKPDAAPASKANINLILDGASVSMDDLKQVNMRDILFMKFLQKASPNDLPSLAITTRLAVDRDNIINNKTGFAVAAGYTTAREFYAPQYAVAMDDQTADYRSTIYWNPRVVLDKNHKSMKLVFYNNDISNKLRVVIEGFNKDGKLARLEETLR